MPAMRAHGDPVDLRVHVAVVRAVPAVLRAVAVRGVIDDADVHEGWPVNLTDAEIDALVVYGADVLAYVQGDHAEPYREAMRKLRSQQNAIIAAAVKRATAIGG